MKTRLTRSFRGRLFVAFLIGSLVPLLLCSAMLLQIFRLRMTENAAAEVRESMNHALHALDTAVEGFTRAAGQLETDELVSQALETGSGETTQVYSRLFTATAGLRDYARFDLYDREGIWRYSTLNAPSQRQLPTNWGILGQANREEGLTFVASEDVTNTAVPLLRGGMLLRSPQGETVGYLVISLYQADLRQLLDGTYGSQNDLILLSQYWRPVYCTQPSLAASLAPVLRQQLLLGEELDKISEEFSYQVALQSSTGLYLVLRHPRVFNHDTMVLLYTVSASCALVCVLISVLMSLKLSRQMFRPVQRLHTAIGEVVQNNLDVQVPLDRNDELGELAQRFNGMVVALKRNQEELVKNQKELNEAQIRMLQAQLNPHFLCNTLDTMKWISKINQVPQVAVMSTDLADILRFCISPEEFVPLRREVEILERYIEIQKIRLSSAFIFTTHILPELEECLVPKMILQPIVENAILHGLEGVEQGTIRVIARREDEDRISLVVEDNGRGLPPEMAGPYANRDRERSRGHLGLYNVDTILRKYYGEGFGLWLDCGAQGRGAVVRATLPLRWEEETEC